MKKENQKQEKKMKKFLKSNKGAEIVEIIIGVVIAIALGAFAWWFIQTKINDASNDDKQFTTAETNNMPANNVNYIQVGNKIIDFE